MRRSVLIVEDEKDIADLMSLHLTDAGFCVTHTDDGVSGLSLALTRTWDLVVLDLSLPRLDGIEICQRIRQCNPHIPIVLVTARTTEQERITGLDSGADDYISKPFSVLEMVARIRAIFRRLDTSASVEAPDIITAGSIVLDKRTHTATVSGHALNLTPKEFDLLCLFARSPGQVFKRHELLEEVWGYQHGVYMHTVNSHINRLRAKLDAITGETQYIKTVWGIGYKFSENEE